MRDGPVRLRDITAADAPAYAAAFRDDPGLGAAIGVERDPDEASVVARLAEAPGLRERGAFVDQVVQRRWGQPSTAWSCCTPSTGATSMRRSASGWRRPPAAAAIGIRAVRLLRRLGLRRARPAPDGADHDARQRGRHRAGPPPRVRFEGVMRERNLERGGRVDVSADGRAAATNGRRPAVDRRGARARHSRGAVGTGAPRGWPTRRSSSALWWRSGGAARHPRHRDPAHRPRPRQRACSAPTSCSCELLLLARLPVLERLVGFDRLTIWHRRNGARLPGAAARARRR